MAHRSRIYSVLIDCPEDRIEQSVQFWSEALGRPIVAKTDPSSPYTDLETPESSTLDIALQKIRSQDSSRLHFDIETDDVEAEVRRLEQLGACRREHIENWWVMEAPSGHLFCVVPVESKAWPADAVEWQ